MVQAIHPYFYGTRMGRVPKIQQRHPADVADTANSTRPMLYCSKRCGAGQNGAVTLYNQCLSGSRMCET